MLALPCWTATPLRRWRACRWGAAPTRRGLLCGLHGDGASNRTPGKTLALPGPPPPLPHKTIVLHAGPAIIVVVCACPRLQGDSFDPTSLTLVYGWGAKGAFATKAEAKAAFLEALKQVRPANRQSMPADVPCGLCRDGGPPCA